MKLPSDPLDRILVFSAQVENIDPDLMRALSVVETAADPWKVRYEPEFGYFLDPKEFARRLGISVDTETALQRTSWGPMQIMGAVARECGYIDHLTKLTDPAVAYRWSAVHLSKLLKRYPDNVQDVVAAWNFGSARKGADGLYLNQGYVNKVNGVLNAK